MLMVLPWLYPFTPGPTPTVVPWIVSAAAACALWALQPHPLPSTPLMATAVAACVAMTASLGGISPEIIMSAGCMLLVLGCAGMVRGSTERAELVSEIAAAWLVAALASCVFALIQYFGWADHFSPWISAPASPEAISNLRQRNQFASLAAIGLVALVWFCRRGLRLRYGLGMAVLLAFGIAASTSRTGALLVALIAGMTWAWAGRGRRHKAIVPAVAVLAYVVGALLLPGLQDRLAGVQSASALQRFAADLGCSSRQVLWSNVLDLIALKPWLGWGWGELDYAHYATLYPAARFCDIVDNAHNLPLHLAAELGLPLAALFLVPICVAVWRASPWREPDLTRQMAWGVLAILGLHSLVEYPLWYGPFQISLGLALGLLSSGLTAMPGARLIATLRGVQAVFACALAYAAWDYYRVSQIYLPPEARAPAYRADALGSAQASWLFRNQARFAELTITEVDGTNADALYQLAGELLHYSPEARVIEKRIECAQKLDLAEEVKWHAARYQAAFPSEYASWLGRQQVPSSNLPGGPTRP